MKCNSCGREVIKEQSTTVNGLTWCSDREECHRYVKSCQNISNQTMQLADELDKLIHRFKLEYDLEYAQVVGVLTMKAHLLMNEAENENV